MLVVDLARPLMRAWYLSREAALAAVPFPQDAPVVRVPGPDPLRVLLVGNGAATGWGVRSHDLALPGHLARQLSSASGRGVQVDARVDGALRLDGLRGLLDDVPLHRYDAVLVVAGMSDAVNLTPTAAWRASMLRLLDRIRDGAPGATLLVVGPQPVRSVPVYAGWPGQIAERHLAALLLASQEVCDAARTPCTTLPAPSLAASSEGHRSPAVYEEWASAIADALGPTATTRAERGDRHDAASEPRRQRATELMRPDAPADPQLDRITRLARQLFGVDVAAVTMLDGDTQKHRSISGAAPATLPRASSMCDHTIRGDGALVVGDLAEDPRFAAGAARAGVRFYAGYPIESPDGHRVGALCILDAAARDPADVDVDALSDLALLAQKELWASAERSLLPGPSTI